MINKERSTNKICFSGVALSGGKADRSCVAIVEFFKPQNKIFLTELFSHICNDQKLSADSKIIDILHRKSVPLKLIAIDAPLHLPLCLQCRLKCPGYEICKEPHIRWMWHYVKELNRTRRPARVFTPYTQRCAEMYLSTKLEETFVLSHALGANAAPLAARAMFLQRRLKNNLCEVHARVALWRIGLSLKIAKSHLRNYKHAVSGRESREVILQSLTKHNVCFLYAEDLRCLQHNVYAFEAFICALTACLKFRKLVEKRPAHFPPQESWIEIPIENIKW